MDNWFALNNLNGIPTPSLVVYPGRITENILRMISIGGGAEKIMPHVKTHKMAEIIRLHISAGINQFKCSTIAEAEMVALCGAKEIVLAMQPTGFQIERFFSLVEKYPGSSFSTLIDCGSILYQIADKAQKFNRIIHLWLDINNGMNRTGIEPGTEALELYKRACALPSVKMKGLHVYDGHIHDADPALRAKHSHDDFEKVGWLIDAISGSGLEAPVIIAGGSPTFPVHAGHKNTITSPGTTVLWDEGYATRYKDLNFLQAAVIITRVVSRPAAGLLCLDLGHKAIAAEMQHPRMKIMNLVVSEFLNHSEEHLVIKTPEADKYPPGDVLYAVPWHICPTVPRYPAAYVAENGLITGEWKIDARDRKISV